MSTEIKKGQMVKIKLDTYDPATSFYEVLKVKTREGFPCKVATIQSIYPTYPQEELVTDLIPVEISEEEIKELQLEWGRRHRE